MITCHQCGNKITIYSNNNKIKCPRCRAEYTTKTQEQSSTKAIEKINRNSELDVHPVSLAIGEKINHDESDKTHIWQYHPPTQSFDLVKQIKIGLMFWGTFKAEYLEELKSLPNSFSYQSNIKKKNNNTANHNIHFLPNNNVLIGRKSSSVEGFEDVDIKIEIEDTYISRRQCQIETIMSNNAVKVLISTHPKASNLIEINGIIVKKGEKQYVKNGDFIRLGNSLFEILFDNPILDKTVVYQNY